MRINSAIAFVFSIDRLFPFWYLQTSLRNLNLYTLMIFGDILCRFT